MRSLCLAAATTICLLPTARVSGQSPSTAPAVAVPVVDLPAATIKSARAFGAVLGVRENGSSVLVNDGGRRQLFLLDTALSNARVVFDSITGNANSYGPYSTALNPYLADSSIVADVDARTLLVLNREGSVVKSIALPSAMDVGAFMGASTWTDPKGRLFYKAGNMVMMPKVGTVGPQEVFLDSTPVLRADLDLRRVDTIGRVAKIKGEYSRIDRREERKVIRAFLINPLPAADEFAVLTDGSVAFVRGYDYHIDWLRPDGSRSSSPKLPFDWKAVTDEGKQKLIDSTLAVYAERNKFAEAARNAPPPPPPPMDGSTQRQAGGAGITRAAYDAGGNLWVPANYEVVSAKEIPDYYPAIRQGAVMADLDNHLWVLPTTSAYSRNGELVYDEINTKGELFRRVRLPAGRIIAGFGADGVVYMLVGNKNSGFILERTRLPSNR